MMGKEREDMNWGWGGGGTHVDLKKK